MFHPLMDFDAQQEHEDACQPPTREELWARFIHGTLTLVQWADSMNAFYPLSAEELANMAAKREAEARR